MLIAIDRQGAAWSFHLTRCHVLTVSRALSHCCMRCDVNKELLIVKEKAIMIQNEEMSL